MSEKDIWKRAKKLLEILGNETRIEILRLLSQKQCYVSEISRELDVGQQAILRHLKLLSEFNFLESFEEQIEDENRGRGRKRKYYTLSEDFPFKKFLIDFSEEHFSIQLQDDQNLKEFSDSQDSLLESWPGLKFYERELAQINNIRNPVEKLKYVVDLMDRLRDEYDKHQIAIQYISKLLTKLDKLKEDIKSNI
ncbi:MAG: ArsR/SmtB family transcription factor [Candidatus Helarchaeota archaeon]